MSDSVIGPRDIEAKVRYIKPHWRDRPEIPTIGSGETRRANTAYYDVAISDARAADVDAELGLDTSGFTLVEHSTTAAGSDEEVLRRRYRPEMLELIAELSGATATFPFGHLVRTEDGSDFNTAYARFVHCDYNERALRKMAHDILARHHVEPEPEWVFAFYNTWQPFDHHVEQNAMAFLDARSLSDDDIIDYAYTGHVDPNDRDNAGLVAAPVYNPNHRWYYYPEMTPAEVLVSKQIDPRPGRASQCPHTSFVDEAQPADVAPRRSVETRILAIFAP